MGTLERREREKARVRDKIKAAARELFASEGYGAVSMRRIAEAIEYSPTAIYVHFADKDALMREICRDDFDRLSGAFAELAAITDPVERIRRVGHAYIEFGATYPNHYRLMFMTERPALALDADDLARKGRPEADGYAFLRAAVSEAIAQGRVRTGVPADAELLAQTLWAGMHGVTSIEISHCKDRWIELSPLQERARMMADLTTDGIFAPAAGASAAASENQYQAGKAQQRQAQKHSGEKKARSR